MKTLLTLVWIFLCLSSSAQTASAYLKEGNRTLKAKNYSEAIIQYDKVLKITPNDTVALLGIITAKIEIWQTKYNNNDNLLTYMDKYVSLKRYDPGVYIFRSEIESNRGKTNLAILDLDTAIRLDHNNAKAYSEREIARHNIGDTAGATSDFKKYLELSSNESVKILDSVYLCMGNNSIAYHNSVYCKGLKKCSTDLIKVSLYDAQHKYHRKPCGYCYR